MVFENIEKLKAEYTDKFVRVDADRPELARFKGFVGQVKTVNMSGRALVEFGEFYDNIGWHDIDLDYLKVVDAPTSAERAAAPQPAAKKVVRPTAPKASTASNASQPQQTAPASGTSQPSPQGAAVASDAPRLAESAAAGIDRSKMSVADILAEARAGKSGGGAAVASKPSKPAEPQASPPPAAEQAPPTPAPEPEPEPEPEAAASPPAGGDGFDRSSMSVEQMLAYCREHDAS